MQIRIKQDPKRFAEFWRDQYAAGQHNKCARMAESCILAQKGHSRVPINGVCERASIGIPELARLLVEAGGVSPAKVKAACPESDPAKSALVEEMEMLWKTRVGSAGREDKHPFVLTMAFINDVARSARRYDARKKVFVPNV